MRQKLMIILLTIVTIIAAFGCKTSSEATPPGTNPSPTSTNAVSIRDNSFSPGAITIDPGTTVTWTHNGMVVHTVTSGTEDMHTGLFDSGDLTNGQTFQFTFTDPGMYDYHCHHHPGMSGTVMVRQMSGM